MSSESSSADEGTTGPSPPKRARPAESILDFEFRKKRVRMLRPSIAEVLATGSDGILYWMSRDMRVQDNWALLYAQKLAIKNRMPLNICYCLHANCFPARASTMRNYAFLIGGLRAVADACRPLNIAFDLLHGDANNALNTFVRAHRFGCIVCDFSPLREPRQQLAAAVAALPAELAICQVDAHNIVPVWVTSDKLEYAARTIRSKVNGKLDVYLQEFPPVVRQTHGRQANAPSVNWDRELAAIKCERTVPKVQWADAGPDAAAAELDAFCRKRLAQFAAKRNDPTANALSNLAPWLRFGHISAQRCVLTVRGYARKHAASVAAFCEEAIVRRELAENFCFYNEHYDSLAGLSDWARATLLAHKKDKREWCYRRQELEHSRTHDDLWNAAQKQLVVEGKMHGFLRMYWAKKILEWTAGPEEALADAIHLNDKYSLDGYSPNGFVGCMWSIGGIHDMGWKERPIFGKIRYMNYAGCRRKFDVAAFVARYGGKVYGKTGDPE